MRPVLVVLHRWLGLFSAVFLFIAGLTGAVISWDHEIDAWLNPDLAYVKEARPALPVLDVLNRLEAENPNLRVTYSPLAVEPGHTLVMSVHPKVDPTTQKAYPLDFDQIAVDPADGRIQGQRMWGEASLSRRNLMPFLYKLHYSLHLPATGGIDWGVLLMGVVAIVWSLDAFIALYISFPNLASWRKSFAFRVRAGGYRLLFDLHRSGGVWVWPLLFVLAVTGVSMNLEHQVVRPVVSIFSTLSPDPFGERAPRPDHEPATPKATREEVLARAQAEAERRGITAPAGGLFYAPAFDVYGVGFFEPGRDHGDGGLGNPWLYFDGQDGRALGGHVPGEGSGGDLFMQAQFPLHSGRILGLPGRILVSLLGLLVAVLSVTGVVIWARKRRARRVAASQRRAAVLAPAE